MLIEFAVHNSGDFPVGRQTNKSKWTSPQYFYMAVAQ